MGAGTLHLTAPVSPSQSDIGFGKLETYVKLDKLGEVSSWVWFPGSHAGGRGPCPLMFPAPPRCVTLAWPPGQPLAGFAVSLDPE